MTAYNARDISEFLAEFSEPEMEAIKRASMNIAINFDMPTAIPESWLLFQAFQEWMEKRKEETKDVVGEGTKKTGE